MKFKIIALSIITIIGILTCINPLYPHQQLLQHLGTLILLIPLIIDLKKQKLYISTYICFSIYIVLHIIGARYIYSYVPYDKWLYTIFGFTLADIFQFSRNNYDRFIHFSFGLLLFPYFYQIIKNKITKTKKIIIAWLILQTLSMFYELFEWSLTMIMSQEAAENYNGQQGDIFDAQKDMALAMAGSTIMVFAFFIKNKTKKINTIKNCNDI